MLTQYANNIAIVKPSGEKICNAAPLRAMRIVECGDGKPVWKRTKIRAVIWLREQYFAQAISAKPDLDRENTESSSQTRPTKYVHNHDTDYNVRGVWTFYRLRG